MAESSAAGARRRPRKLDRARSDQESVRSGQKHTVLDDTEIESVYPATSEALTTPQIQDITEEDTPQAAAEASVPQTQQSPRQRRRPRKLLRNPGSGSAVGSPSAGQDDSIDVRVNRLEAQVHTLSRRLDSTALEIGRLQAQSPQSASFADGASTTANALRAGVPPVQADMMRNAQSATAALERANPSFPRGTANALVVAAAADDADVEEIPRAALPSARPESSRTVSLTGNYKIPLPSTLSTDDVRAIKEGVFAAGSIAKEITAALRGSHSADVASEDGAGPGTETPRTPGSWARLIEGASQLVQKAAHAIELDAAVEASGSRIQTTTTTTSAESQAKAKWKKKTATNAPDARPSSAGSATPEPGSSSKAKGKRPAAPARASSGAGSSSKVL